ncbi:hypothetical protein FRC06_002582 [Ceratobasidium sp. 370]|nr:hypothetical protein FRC06_002582 [Ceratobasidium sp. 370]
MASGSITDVFGNWHVARDQLELAVDSFLGACATLHQFVDQVPASSKVLGLIEDYGLKLNDQMEVLATIAAKITQSRAILRRVINTSTILVPINVLPPEILSRIFVLTVSSYPPTLELISHRVHPLVVIPAICTQWRRLAINTRSLWSRVDVNGGQATEPKVTRELGRVQLWLERAHGTALHLHFRAVFESDQLLPTLQPHWTRVTSLVFRLSDGNFFQTALNRFASCPPGLLTTLIARHITAASGREDEETSAETDAPRSPWSTKLLHNIVNLELVHLAPQFCLNADELISILANSPYLQTLRLRNVSIMPSQDNHHPLINLPYLRVLDLSLKDDPVLQNLVSILVPGKHELDVRIVMPRPNNRGFNATMHALFQRSHVTRFVAWSLLPNGSPQLAGYLDCLPELQALVLDCSREVPCTSLAALTIENEGKIQARCPSLQTLGVLGAHIGSLAQNQLKLLVSTYRLDELKFGDQTRVIAESDGDWDGPSMLEWIRQRGQTLSDVLVSAMERVSDSILRASYQFVSESGLRLTLEVQEKRLPLGDELAVLEDRGSNVHAKRLGELKMDSDTKKLAELAEPATAPGPHAHDA